jgi:hypothetical protein
VSHSMAQVRVQSFAVTTRHVNYCDILQFLQTEVAALDLSLAAESDETLLELKHYNLGIRSQPQRRSPRSCSAGSENLHFPDAA